MKQKIFTFPITPENFISYQESIMHRKCNAGERYVLTNATEIINAMFEAGASRRGQCLIDGINTLDDINTDNKDIENFLHSLRWWMCSAYKDGMLRSDGE